MLQRLVGACSFVLFVFVAGSALASESWGWQEDGRLARTHCTVEQRETLSQAEFDALFSAENGQPVIVATEVDAAFLRRVARDALLASHGDEEVTLSVSSTFSYSKRTQRFADYVNTSVSRPLEETAQLSSPDFLLFGDHSDGWNSLLAAYRPPALIKPSATVALSFGVAGPGTGVPFHVHGPTWAQTLVGRKRWFLYPPDRRPPIDGEESVLRWMERVEGGSNDALRAHGAPSECTLPPGRALFVPDGWWHATLNVDETVFISSFVDERRGGGSELR